MTRSGLATDQIVFDEVLLADPDRAGTGKRVKDLKSQVRCNWAVGFPDLVVFFQLHDGQGNTRYGTMGYGRLHMRVGVHLSPTGGDVQVRVIPCDHIG